jgi:WD40 repeat protein
VATSLLLVGLSSKSRLYAMPGATVLRELDQNGIGTRALAFSPDGKLLASGAQANSARL